MKKRILGTLLATALLGASLTGCADQSATSSAASKDTENASASVEQTEDVDDTGDAIKLGVLFSASGSTSTFEDVCANIVQMMVDDVNANGGINGKQIVTVREDYASDPTVAVEKMKKLIMQDHVIATVGTYASASRNAVKPVAEENDSLLVYPTSYEGETPSKDIVYTGAISQQMWEIFVPWLEEKYGNKIFFLYNDSTGTVLMTEQAIAVAEQTGAEIVGSEIVPTGHTDFSSVITKIIAADPDVIISGMWSDSEAALYKQLANYGISMKDLPVAGVTSDENVYKAAGNVCEGAVLCASYLNTLDNEANTEWKETYYGKYDDSYELTALAESTYVGTYFLLEALKKIDNDDYSTESILKNMEGITLDAPEGEITYNPESHHFNMSYKIGVVNSDAKLDVIYTSDLIEQNPLVTD